MRWVIVVTIALLSPMAVWGSVSIFVSPSHTIVEEGESFSLGMRVDAGADTITCFLVEFMFDEEIIEIASAEEGTLFRDCGFETMFSWDVRGPGWHSCNDVTLGHWAYAICPGELVSLDFTALSPGDTPIDITMVDLRDINRDPISGVGAVSGTVSVMPATGVEAPSGAYPHISLCPNPFERDLFIRFTSDVKFGTAEVAVHNVAGRTVEAWTIEWAEDRTATVVWDGRDSRGSAVPSGAYFVVVRGAEWERRGRVVLLR